MVNIFFRYYLKKNEFGKLNNLKIEQINKIWNNNEIHMKDKIKIIFQNRYYEILSTLDDKVIDEIINNKSEFGLKDDQIVKILCQKKHYDKIGDFIEPIDRITNSSLFSEEEFILAFLAKINFYRKEIDSYQERIDELNQIEKAKFTKEHNNEREILKHGIKNLENRILSLQLDIRKKPNGIKTLFHQHNNFFDENFPKILNLSFLDYPVMVKDDLISFLYMHGYSQPIKDNLYKLSIASLMDLLVNDKIKDELISREFLKHKMYFPYFFENLPPTKRPLIAYFCLDIFEKKERHYKSLLSDKQENLKKLFRSNFEDVLTEEEQDKIMGLYGVVPSYAIENVIQKMLIDSTYIDKVAAMSSKYLNGKIELGFILDTKYPDIAQTLFLGKTDVTSELQEKLIYLCNKPLLEKITTLEIFSQMSLENLKNLKYNIQNQISKKPNFELSPTNLNKCHLFNYEREILIVDREGEIDNKGVYVSHPETLGNMYTNKINLTNKNHIEVLYEANMMGDAIFVIENAAVILYLPPTISSNQKIQLLKMIKHLENHERKDKIVIYSGFAIPDTKCEYVYFNDGDKISILELMNEINKLKVDDEGKMLHPSVEIQVKK